MQALPATTISPPDSVSHRPLLAVVRDDPFDPNPPQLVDVRPGETLSGLIDRIGFDPFTRPFAVAVINGEEIPETEWETFRVRDGQHVAICIAPQGGGDDGNKVLTTVLTIFVLVAAFWVGGGALAGTLGDGFAQGALGANLAAGAVSAVGQLAISALVKPPAGPTQDKINPVYNIDGASNQFRPFDPIILSLGRRRVFPRQVARGYQEIVGDDFYYRMVVEWGPIGVALSDIKVGDTPIASFDGVQMQHRLVDSDPHPTLYPAEVFQEAVGASLDSTDDWEARRTIADATEVTVVIGFPAGLGHTSKKGKSEQWASQVEIRFRSITGEPGSEVLGGWASPPGNNVSYPSRGGVVPGPGKYGFSEKKRNQPFFRAVRFDLPVAGLYEVEVRRSSNNGDPDAGRTMDDMVFQVLESRRPGVPVARDDVAYSVFRFKGSDETQGRIQTLNAIVDRLIPRFDPTFLDNGDLSTASAAELTGAASSSNMWEQIPWLYRNGFEGRDPLADSAIDWPSFAAAAKNAKDNGRTFDHVFEGAASIDEAVETAAFAGCGRAAFIGNKLTAVVDAPQLAPVAVISDRTARNVKAVKRLTRPPHGFRIQFDDASDGFRTREIIVYVDGHSRETATRFETIKIPGVVHWDAVHRLVERNFKNSRLQNRIVTAEVPVDAVDTGMRLGRWVGIQTRVVEVGRASGWIRSVETNGLGDVTAVILDQPVEQTVGDDLVLQWSRSGGPGVSEALGNALEVSVAANAVSERIELAVPATGSEKPQAGDSYVYGVQGYVRLDGLIDDIDPVDEKWLRLHLVNYAPERFDETGFVLPPYVPGFERPAFIHPPELELVSISQNLDQTVIHFRPKPGERGQIAGLVASRAIAPDAGTTEAGVWEALPDLAATERQLTVTSGEAGDAWIYRIAAVGPTGEIGPYLVVDTVEALEGLPSPTGVVVQGTTEEGAGGSRRPLLTVTATPVEDVQIDYLVVGVRRVALDLEDNRLSEAEQPAFTVLASVPARVANAQIRGLAAGARIDVEVYFRGKGQRESLVPVQVDDVVLPAIDIAGDVSQVGGREAFQVIEDLDTNALSIARETLQRATWSAAKESYLWIGGETVGSVAKRAMEANDDSAQSLALLGTRNGPNSAFILNSQGVVVPASGEAGSSAVSLLTFRTQVDKTRSDVTWLLESVDGLSAQATLALDVNGYVTGFKVINNGVSQTSGFYVIADNFAIASPGSGLTAPFYPFSVVGDRVYADELWVRRIQVDSIETQSLKDNSITERLVVSDGSVRTLPNTAGYGVIESFAYDKSSAGSNIEVKFHIKCGTTSSASLWGGFVRIKRNGVVVSAAEFAHLLEGLYGHSLFGSIIVNGVPAGSSTWSVEMKADRGVGGGTPVSDANCNFSQISIEEVKK